MTAPEPLLTIRQPWASAIFLAGKDIENRTWRTDQHGRLWIHAARRRGRWEPTGPMGPSGQRLSEEPLPRGVILGCVDLVGCVEGSSSPWAVPGYVHWCCSGRCCRPTRCLTGVGRGSGGASRLRGRSSRSRHPRPVEEGDIALLIN